MIRNKCLRTVQDLVGDAYSCFHGWRKIRVATYDKPDTLFFYRFGAPDLYPHLQGGWGMHEYGYNSYSIHFDTLEEFLEQLKC